MPAADGRVGEGTGHVSLSDAGRPDDDNGLVVLDEVGVGEREDLGAVEPPLATEVDVLDDGGQLQFGGLQVAGHATVLPGEQLAVDEETQSFLEPEALVVGMAPLLDEPLHHGGEVQRE